MSTETNTPSAEEARAAWHAAKEKFDEVIVRLARGEATIEEMDAAREEVARTWDEYNSAALAFLTGRGK